MSIDVLTVSSDGHVVLPAKKRGIAKGSIRGKGTAAGRYNWLAL